MRTIKLIIAYDGTAYHGFQRQQNALAVQQVLEKKLEPLFGHQLVLHGAGRTDAGVHAAGQVVSFTTTGTIPAERICRAASSLLPDDIVVLAAEDVADSFHARKSAVAKTYLYRIYQGSVGNPFSRNYAWHIRHSLDIDEMREAMQWIQGTHDFSSFRATGSVMTDPVRTIYEAKCIATDEGLITLSFTGNGFLYHMVRNLTGVLVDVGLGRYPGAKLQAIIAAKNRRAAAITAPAQGLYLFRVYYDPKQIFPENNLAFPPMPLDI